MAMDLPPSIGLPNGPRVDPPRARLVNIAILGGTGKEGAGLAIRWALAGHSIIIGSRDAERARAKAAELREIAKKLPIVGHTNAEAAELGDVVVVALPATGLQATLPEVARACPGKILVSTGVPLPFGGPRPLTPPPPGPAARERLAALAHSPRAGA